MHETLRARGWTLRQWREMSKEDREEILAYELHRRREKIESAKEKVDQMKDPKSKAILTTDALLLDVWLDL